MLKHTLRAIIELRANVPGRNIMSDEAKQLVNTFASLAPPERYAVIVEFARIPEADAGPISDDELTIAGAELFSMYDAEEQLHESQLAY